MSQAHFRSQQQQESSENSFKMDPVRYRLPPTASPMVALNQFRGAFPTCTSYPPLLDVLHEEEESSVSSPATAQLVENQQQLEQLNLHQPYSGGGGGGQVNDGGSSMLRCAPPSIVITGVGSRQGSSGSGSGGQGAIAMR